MKAEELKYDENGLIPVIIQDIENSEVLMMAYMDRTAFEETLKTGKTHFWSRSRKKYWMKGESSGHIQEVKEIYYDCDKDTLLIKVKQMVGACHDGYRSCFYNKLDIKTGKVKFLMRKRSTNKSPKLIGLTGGICCGKSTVAEMFKSLGARIIDADNIARELTKPNMPAWKEIVKKFGEEFLLPDNNLNRGKIAHEVFRNKEKLQALNRIMHPRILDEIKRRAGEIMGKAPKALIVLDAPLLIELGFKDFVKKLIVVSVDKKTQIERIMKRDNSSKKDALLRIKSQMPLSEKVELADYVINNSGSKRETFKVVKKIFSELKDN